MVAADAGKSSSGFNQLHCWELSLHSVLLSSDMRHLIISELLLLHPAVHPHLLRVVAAGAAVVVVVAVGSEAQSEAAAAAVQDSVVVAQLAEVGDTLSLLKLQLVVDSVVHPVVDMQPHPEAAVDSEDPLVVGMLLDLSVVAAQLVEAHIRLDPLAVEHPLAAAHTHRDPSEVADLSVAAAVTPAVQAVVLADMPAAQVVDPAVAVMQLARNKFLIPLRIFTFFNHKNFCTKLKDGIVECLRVFFCFFVNCFSLLDLNLAINHCL